MTTGLAVYAPHFYMEKEAGQRLKKGLNSVRCKIFKKTIF
jgi:hypothetical protein